MHAGEGLSASRLPSFGSGLEVAVIGAAGGVGSAFVRLLADDPAVDRVAAFSRRGSRPTHPKVVAATLDYDRPETVAAAADVVGAPHLVIVATGLLHCGGLRPERSLRELDANALARAFLVNAVGPALVARALLPRMPKGRKTAFVALSARVGSIGDNRLGGWHAYRASKAALNQLVRTLAVEQARRSPDGVLAALHPGTVDTGLSKPFQRGASRLFTPDEAAAHLLAVLDRLTPADSGGFFAWDGAAIAW